MSGGRDHLGDRGARGARADDRRFEHEHAAETSDRDPPASSYEKRAQRALAARPAAGVAATICAPAASGALVSRSSDHRDPRPHAVGLERTRWTPRHALVLERERLAGAGRVGGRASRRSRPRAARRGVDPTRAARPPAASRRRAWTRCAEPVDPRRPARAVVPELLDLDGRALRRPRSQCTVLTPLAFPAMCFPFDAIVPELPAGFQVMAGGAAGERHTLTPPTAPSSPPTSPAPKARPASSSCPTSAACSASTSSSPSASRPPGTPRSRSTTSAARPGSARATRTSSTCRTSGRRTPETSRSTSRPRSRSSATGVERAITVGFCFGGALSFLQATEGHDGLAGVVGFYGSSQRRPGRARRDRPRARHQGPGARPVRRRRRPHPAGPDRRVRGGAAGREGDQGLRGRAALLLRPPRGAVRQANPRTRGNASWDSSSRAGG